MRVNLLGVAAGKGASTPGAENGPLALRELGLVERLTRRGHVVEDLGDIPGVYETRFAARGPQPNILNLSHVLQVNRHLHACVFGTRRHAPNDFLLIIGGDHSMAIGTLAGLSDGCERLGVLWFDAHGDFNTPHTSPSGNAHGMSLAVACGRGPIELRRIGDRDPMIREEDVYLYGCRDLDANERTALEASRINLLSTQDWLARGIVTAGVNAARELAARCDHVHLSFDIDVLDAPLVSGTGTPVVDGLAGDAAIELLTALGSKKLVHSAEFVEYNPSLDKESRTGELTMRLIEALLG